jgi:hypothetical protein
MMPSSPIGLVVFGLFVLIALLVVCRILAGSVREITRWDRGPDVVAQGRRKRR